MVVYDCDGVIFNSEKANFEYYKYLFKKFNLPEININDKKSMNILHTYSNDKVIEHFTKTKKEMNEIIAFSRTADYSQFYKFMQMEEGFAETCKRLKKRGIKIGVATNRSHTFEGIVKYFKLYELIDDYVTVLDVEFPKPEPDMLLFLTEKNGFSTKDIVFIGDSILDYRAAESAEIDFIGYKFCYNKCCYINSHVEIFNYLCNTKLNLK